MGLFFYPRGGSAQVARYLSAALDAAGTPVGLVSGSLGAAGDATEASTFFDRPVLAGDYTEARAWFDRGDDSMEAPFPYQPSFEDRDGVPDRLFARVSPPLATRQVDGWSGVLRDSEWIGSDVFHLHHLTPLHDAVAGLRTEPRIVTHLHGTELKFLAACRDADHGWPFADHWSAALVDAAQRSAHVLCISEHDRSLATDLLGLEDQDISIMPNGVDTELFDRRAVTLEERHDAWREWLVDHPRGWDSSGRPGTINYRQGDLDRFVNPDGPSTVLLFVGRFLGFKRVPLLIRAYARARPHFSRPAPLVIWGGSPGEWEGEHPDDVVAEEGVDDVFFVGWRGHDELPKGLACADVLVAPSTDEPFGQVYLEAMSAGLPVIATTTGGPLAFVNTVPGEPNGWMVPPDDVEALAAALVEAVEDVDERHRRAANAAEQIRAKYAWSSLVPRFAAVYESVAS